MTDLPTPLIIQEAIDMIEASAVGKKAKALTLANAIRAQAWQHTEPRLVAAAGAFEQALKIGASSDEAVETALQAFAVEIRAAAEGSVPRK